MSRDGVLGGLLVVGRELRAEVVQHALERGDRFGVAKEPLLADRDVLERRGSGVLLERRLELDERSGEVAVLEEMHAVREVPLGLVGRAVGSPPRRLEQEPTRRSATEDRRQYADERWSCRSSQDSWS